MKKLFIVMIISSLGFVACNDAATGEGTEDSVVVDETVTDGTSTEATGDSINMDTTTPPVVDTTSTITQ